MKPSNVYTAFNPYFLIPFFGWALFGIYAQWYWGKEAIFIFVNTHYSHSLDAMMSIITHMGEALFIIPVLLLLFFNASFRNPRFAGAASLANIGAFLCSQGLKSIFNHPRPLNYFNEAAWIHILPQWDHVYHRSFPSGHTTGAFALFSFLAFLLPKRYQSIGLLLFMAALMVAYSRVYLAVHFFDDVWVGSILGTVFSILAIRIFYRKRTSQTDE